LLVYINAALTDWSNDVAKLTKYPPYNMTLI